MISYILDKPIRTLLQFIKLLNVAVSVTSIRNTLQNHPDYPSLLAVSDSLKEWNIDNVALKIDAGKLPDLPVPFITTFTGNQVEFIIVINIQNESKTIHYILNGEKIIQPINEFLKEWPGIVLLAEPSIISGEKDYAAHIKEEKLKKLRTTGIITGIFLFLLIVCIQFCFSTYNNSDKAAFCFYTLLHLTGTLISCLLLWYEIDKENPVLQQICSGEKNKTNCGTVLSSKQSKLSSFISWSEVGFFYFCGGLLALLLIGGSILPVIAWLNLVAAPYIVFSIYYQARIVKQWCPLCLGVQAVLVLEIIVCIFTNQLYQPFNFSIFTTPILFVCYALPFTFWSIFKPGLLNAQEAKKTKRELNNLKYNEQLFQALLKQQKQIVTSTEGLGITLGNKQARNTLIKVCNPYCGPCANAHPVIDALLELNKDLKVQIIFTASSDGDRRAEPVKHLLAIAAQANEAQTAKALDDWYMAPQKDYKYFAQRYPLQEDLDNQNNKLNIMHQWCEDTQILFTPTFFINGYQLPQQYNIQDLKYILFG